LTIDEYFLISTPPRAGSLKKKWITTILTSITGDEQRFALLTWPRRTLTYNFSPLDKSDLNYVNRVLFKNLHKTWGFPFLQDKTLLTSTASSGQKILNIGSSSFRNFEVGAPCIILESRSSYEVGTIDVLAETQITLKDNLAQAWPAGTPVYPVLKAKISAEEEIAISNSRTGGISIMAAEDYDGDITRHVPDISMFQLYKDAPVFNFRPKTGALKQRLSHPYDYLDYLGKSYSESNWIETGISLRGAYLARTKETIWQYLDFFDAHKGRWGNFWIPSFQRDIVVTEPFLGTDTVLTIEPIDYPDYWDDSETARYVVFRWPDDTIICREIVDCGSDTITLDSVIGKSCDNPGILLASFLLFGRFDIDEIEINYSEFDSQAAAEISFRSLPLETPA
jgi:hypothetical protein